MTYKIQPTKNCLTCGKEFSKRSKQDLARWNGRKYCEIACYYSTIQKENHHNWKGGFRQRKWHIARTYGITPDIYEAMYESQDGLCAICNEREATCIDHDHNTGGVRELLCRKCNVALGMIGEKSELLQSAADYLARWGA